MNLNQEVRTLNRRHTWKWLVTAASLAVGLALIASACGSSSKSGSGDTTAASSSGGKTFANFKLAYDTGIDYLDPGLSYTVEGWGIMWNVYLPLIGYKHVNGPDGATIVPYLAKALPTVSADGTTYTFTLEGRSQVLGRHADQGERLPGDHRARLQGRLAGRRLLREHRRGGHVRQDEDRSHQRHHRR